jgi:hypothetical protein
MSGGPMNLDINVEEHDWKTIPSSGSFFCTNLLTKVTPVQTHPLSTQQPKSTAKLSQKDQKIPKISLQDDPLRAMMLDPLSAAPLIKAPEPQPDPTPIHPQLGPMPEQIVQQQTPEKLDFATTAASSSSSPSPSSASSNDVYNEIISKLQRKFQFWNEKVPGILEKYTTSTSIAVDNNFLNDNAAASGEQSQQQPTPDMGKQKDQAAQRLEEIENEASDSKAAKSYLSQKDFISHIEEQHTKLLDSWQRGERVAALRIVIKCAEMLANMTIPQFYPSMYVILTRILDTFGDLVFDRIRERGIQSIDSITRQIIYQPLSATFRASDVCSSAKETCKNWFFKTICIRELLPRLYIDLSLIKCYRFLEDDTFASNLLRVCAQIRGVGDPLTASYLRAYIATKSLDISYSFHETLPPPSQRYFVAPSYRQAVKNALNDWIVQHKYLKQTQCSNVPIVKKKDITPQEYFALMAPSIEWMVQVLYYNEDNEEEFSTMLKELILTKDDLIILSAMLNAFNPDFLRKFLKPILGLVHGFLDPLREEYHKYQDMIDVELEPTTDEDSDDSDSDESDDDDDGDDGDHKKKKKGKKKKNIKQEKEIKKKKPTTTAKIAKIAKISQTQNSAEYLSFLTLHKYTEEFATSILATICNKLIMSSNTSTPLNMTSSLLNALWSGIYDCPYKEFVNEHSPSLALLICVHGRWNDTSVLLGSALQTLQTGRFGMNMIATVDGAKEEMIEYNNAMKTIENIFALTQHLISLLTSDYILSILDQLQTSQRVKMATILLQRYKEYIISIQNNKDNKDDKNDKNDGDKSTTLPKSWKTNDFVLIHTLHELCHHIHTSVSALSTKSEVDTISELCQYVILSVDYQLDVETQLSTYVSFRASLSELPQILSLLVYQVNKLAMSALQLVTEKKNNNGIVVSTKINPSSHNRKTANFVKAAIAFCHITIPSLPHYTNSNIYNRIMLFLTSAQTSIANNLLPQAEALITAAVQQLSMLSTEVKTQEGSSVVKHMSIHDMSFQVTNTIQTILSTICMLPPVGGQWLRLLGIVLNVLDGEKKCECVDLIAVPTIYVNSLYVIATMTHTNGVLNDSISKEEKVAIKTAMELILTKFLFSVKVLYTAGGGIVSGLSKDENSAITTILSALNVKYPPQLICDTLTSCTMLFFHVMKLDAYTATIIYSIITGVREILKSHPYSGRTIEHFIQFAQDKSTLEQSSNGKEFKIYRDLAKKLVTFLGK